MLVDLTVEVTPQIQSNAKGNEPKVNLGHIGTHFDVMDKVFPLEYLERDAVIFDVSAVAGRDIEAEDFDMSLVREGMFVAFASGFLEREGYGTKAYFSEHPQLSDALITGLTAKHIAIIGVDFAGIRRGAEHSPADQRCADQGTFVVENLCNLSLLLGGNKHAFCRIHTYPLNFSGISGLPCRVVAKQ